MKFGDAMVLALLIQIPLIPVVAFVDWINAPDKPAKVVCYYQGGFGHFDDPTVHKYTTIGNCETTHKQRYFLKKEIIND